MKVQIVINIDDVEDKGEVEGIVENVEDLFGYSPYDYKITTNIVE